MNRGELIKTYSSTHSRNDTARLAVMLMGYDGFFLNDERWITVKGTHVRLDKNGRPDAGPKKLRKALSGKGQSEKLGPGAGPPKDVTSEYRRTAKPGKGRIVKASGYNKSDSPKGDLEWNTAEWLVKTFGGTVTMNRQTNEPGASEKNPEYTWRGKLWEFKEPERNTVNSIQQNFQNGLHQIKKNPGGVVMDITKCGASFKMATEAIADRARRSARFNVDVIILKRGSDYRVLRFEPRKETDQDES